MDMKKILRTIDSVKNHVEGSNDMKKFMTIINEGANPHKVSLPVQMAMQHYAEPVVHEEKKPSLLKQYFAEAEDAFQQQKVEKRQLINQYAKMIAERVQMKESYNPNLSPNPGFTGGVGPGLQNNTPTEAINIPDVVKMDIPLLIRLLEYAREDAKTDMDLHNVTEKAISLSVDGGTLTMSDYNKLTNNPEITNEMLNPKLEKTGSVLS